MKFSKHGYIAAIKKHFQLVTTICLVMITSIVSLVYIVKTVQITPLGFPFDDSWIHAVFARNLIEQKVFSFNPPIPSHGTTSLLWVILLTLIYGITGKIAFSSLFIGSMSLVMLVIGTHQLSLVLYPVHWKNYTYAPALLIGTTGLLQFHALSGLETILFLALGIWSIVTFLKEKHLLASILLGLTILTRIEGIVLLTLITTFYVFQPHRKIKTLLAIVLPALMLFLGEIVFNLAIAKSPLPSTFAGKRWLFVGNGQVTEVYKRYFQFWLSEVAKKVLFGGNSYILIFLFLFLAFLVSTVGITILWKQKSPTTSMRLGFLLVISWGICHNLLYLIILPAAGNAGRYQLLNIWLFWFLFSTGLIGILQFKNVQSYKIPLLTLIGIFLITTQLISVKFWQTTYTQSVNHINLVHRKAGEFIATTLPENTTVAAFDIGAIGYFGKRNILDLGCLIGQKGCETNLINKTMSAYILEKQPSYLALPEGPEFNDFLELKKDHLFQESIMLTQLNTWSINIDTHFEATSNAWPRITLYQITYKQPQLTK
ncbi:MAG: hypothetical protein WCP97_01975 [bacterium]